MHALKVGRIADIFEFVGAAFTVPTRDATEIMISKCFIKRGDINCCEKVPPTLIKIGFWQKPVKRIFGGNNSKHKIAQSQFW